MMTIQVLEPGVLTTVQDGGRDRLRKFGVPVGGAMDRVSMRIANMLVGNDEYEAVLEITLSGPSLRFDGSGEIAICGADLEPAIMGTPAPMYRPVPVNDQDVLEFGLARRGCRAYLALAGGLDVPTVLGSRSMLLASGIEGIHGRTLIAGDQLSQRIDRAAAYPPLPHWYVAPFPRIDQSPIRHIRVIRGPEFGWCTNADRLFSETFTISPDSNRMGYRLTGPRLECTGEMLTDGVAPGTIQLPPDGSPIILMADCQTTGGYPRIASVATVDLPVIAQMKPGERMRFVEVSLGEAQRVLIEQEGMMGRIKRGIELQRNG